MQIHIVQKGDTLWEIAQQYDADFEEVKKLNPQISSPDMIMPGMKIKIPASSKPVKKEEQQTEAPKEEQKPELSDLFQNVSPQPMPVVEEDDDEAPKQMEPKMPFHSQMSGFFNEQGASAKPMFPDMNEKPKMPAYPNMPNKTEMSINPGVSSYAYSVQQPQPHLPETLHTQAIMYNMTYYYPHMPVYPKAIPCQSQGMYHQPQPVPVQPYAPQPSMAMPSVQPYGMAKIGCGCQKNQPMMQPPMTQAPMPGNQPVYHPVTPYRKDNPMPGSPASSESFKAPEGPALYSEAGTDTHRVAAYQHPEMPSSPPPYAIDGHEQPMPMPPGYADMYHGDGEAPTNE